MRPKYFLLLSLAILLFSCNKAENQFSLDFNQNPPEYRLGDEMEVSVQNPDNIVIDSVVYFYGNMRLGKVVGNEEFLLTFKNQKLGNNPFSAKIYSQGKVSEISETLKLLYNKKPVLYTYKIIETYPHDIDAYTQGLEFYQDTLYESTGLHGISSLRKLDYKTGEVLKKIDLPQKYFGEGITVLNDKIYMLTWQAGKGFIYDVNTFEQLKTFDFDKSKEGWGLTNNGKMLYKSDGTEKIWLLDPETLEEERYIQTVTNHGITTKLNELEWVEGKIYANTYLKDGVVIIDPETGAIEGLIDFRGLREKVTQHSKLDVLNGIAYNPKTKKLYVTGKNWDKLFEVEIIKK
ncbi:MAG TPA: glutaminyl-peptide cyclotransferase [Flavobacteriaceae bacterium]|nr:glutaminyl-peptide cyclotransferase [Flavobacteriaceae bacterium]